MSVFSFLVQAAVTVGIVMLAMAFAEILRRRGFDPIGSIASTVSQRDAQGLPLRGVGG